MSRNQKDIEEIKDTKAKIKQYSASLKPCIVKTPELVKVNNDIHVYKGQGEGETK
jgi:hypothetical protein